MFAPQAYPSTRGHRRGRFTPRIQELTGEESPTAEINATCGHGQFQGCSCRSLFSQGKLSPEERERCFKEKLFMYCSKPGHITTNCNLGKHPGTSLCQMDSIPEDDMDKLSIHDNMEINKLSNNPFAVLTPQDIDINEADAILTSF